MLPLLDRRILKPFSQFRSHLKRIPNAILSHLSLGEAYGVSLLKGKKKLECFIELIDRISDYIKIVGNDNINKEFEAVNDEIPRLSITDAIHIATAIKYKCKSIRILDRDFKGINKKKILKLGTKYNIPIFSISSRKYSILVVGDRILERTLCKFKCIHFKKTDMESVFYFKKVKSFLCFLNFRN